MIIKSQLYSAASLSALALVINLGPAFSKTQISPETKDRSALQSDTLVSGADPHPAPCINWINPINRARVSLLCIHGLGLNADAYTNFGKHMSRLGIATYAIDVRGFGSWLKSQGHDELDFKGSLLDIRQALQSIRAANPGIPLFLLGESMGGAIALRACSMYPELVDGLISSVPAGDRFQQKSVDLKVAIHFAEGPNKQFDIGKQIVDQATQSNALREAWESDPLNRMDLSAKDLMQFQSFMNDNSDAAKKIDRTPVLMVQGTLDRLVKPEGTWDLFERLATKQKTFVALPSEHLVFEEGQVKSGRYDKKAARLVASWIYSCLTAQATLASSDSTGQAPSTESQQSRFDGPQPVFQADSQPSTPTNPDTPPIAINRVSPSQEELSEAIAFCQQGNYEAAKPTLESIIKTEPLNGSAHFWLGNCYHGLEKSKQAQQEFAMARSLNLALPKADKSTSSPAPNTESSSPTAGLNSPPSQIAVTIAGGAPTVLAFGASWCVECQELDSLILQAQNMFGNNVVIKRIDIDDSANAPLVQQFGVGPIPTCVFLRSDGTLSSTLIGLSGLGNLTERIRSILQ